MTDIMANLSVAVLLSQAKLTVCLDGNYFLIVSNLSEYSLPHMLLRVLADCITRSVHSVFYDCSYLRFHIALYRRCAEKNSNMG